MGNHHRVLSDLPSVRLAAERLVERTVLSPFLPVNSLAYGVAVK